MPALGMWTISALVALALAFVYFLVVLAFIPPVAVFVVVSLLIAVGIAMSERRWAPLLGALWSSLVIAANAVYIAHDLAHPNSLHSFAFSVVLMAILAIGILAGLGATIHDYRTSRASVEENKRRQTPRWFQIAVGTLVGLGVGAISVAAIPQDNAAANVSPETLAQLPLLSTNNHLFDRAEIRVKAGDFVALRLENSETSGHSFDIDEFNVHVAMPPGKTAVALFKTVKPGTYTFYCGVPGHREGGMVGTVVVEP